MIKYWGREIGGWEGGGGEGGDGEGEGDGGGVREDERGVEGREKDLGEGGR